MKQGELSRLFKSKQYMPADVLGWLSSPRIAKMSIAQEGAFWRLFMLCWASEDLSIDGDAETLAEVTKMKENWARDGAAILAPFKRLPDGRITHPKVHKVWAMVNPTTRGKEVTKALSAIKENAHATRDARALRDARHDAGTRMNLFVSNNNGTDNGSTDLSVVGKKSESTKAESAARVFAAFCKAANIQVRNHEADRKEVARIIARLDEGFTEEDLMLVIKIVNNNAFYVEKGYNRDAEVCFRNASRVRKNLNRAGDIVSPSQSRNAAPALPSSRKKIEALLEDKTK